MNIEQAKKLKIGQAVKCPPDRGESGYIGKVEITPASKESTNIDGVKYLWVSVRDSKGDCHIWSSNRLSLV